MILSVGVTKGGGGKSTLSVTLAVERARKGKRVLLLNADKQKSCLKWATIREQHNITPHIPCEYVFGLGKDLPDAIEEYHKQYDDVVIDVGGRDTEELRGALTVSHFVLLPLKYAIFDAWEIGEMIEIIQEAQKFNRNLRGAFVVNEIAFNPTEEEITTLNAMLEPYEEVGVTNSGIMIRVRKCYWRAGGQGLNALEFDPNDKKAEREILSLYNLIYDGN